MTGSTPKPTASIGWFLIPGQSRTQPPAFPYRIHPGILLFFFTGGLLMASVLATIAYPATRSALRSPLSILS